MRSRSANSEGENISMNTISPVNTAECKNNSINLDDDKNLCEYVENKFKKTDAVYNLIPYSPTSSETEFNQELPKSLSPPNKEIVDTVDISEESLPLNNIQQVFK